MNTEDLIRADTWWRLKTKLEEELLGIKQNSDDFGFNTDTDA